jgi:hypothetical protein
MIEDKTDTSLRETDVIPKQKITQEAIDYANTKKASRKLYNHKKRIVVKKPHVNKALLPRKVI